MPSFDITSEVDMVALKNAIDVVSRSITNRYDFKGTSANVELNEKDSLMTLFGDSDFQLDQIKDILLPAMEKKEADSAKRLDHQDVQKISGNKLVVAISSRALFDLEESHDLFEREGLQAYQQFQRAREDEPLEPGIAFPLVKKLLALNQHGNPNLPMIEVILLSRTGKEAKALEVAREALADQAMDFDMMNAAYILGVRDSDFEFAIKALKLRNQAVPQQAVDGWMKIAGIYDQYLKDEAKAVEAYRSAYEAGGKANNVLAQIPSAYHGRMALSR